MFLLPVPRRVIERPGTFTIPDQKMIRVPSPEMWSMGSRVQKALMQASQKSLEICTGWAIPSENILVDLMISPDEVRQPQGYQLSIKEDRVGIRAHDQPGLFYGVCTFVQILSQAKEGTTGCLDIVDWPDFPVRGVMLDISRDKVPTMETLYELIDLLASWKINQLQLYTEHTFAYRNHPTVWQDASPVTGADIVALDSYCKDRYIDFVPNQNSFGHMARWLKHQEYCHLAETMGEYVVPWGVEKGPFSLNPTHPGSLELVRSLYDELLPYFSSQLFNVGLDETFDLGQGASREICAKVGKDRVYLEFLLSIYRDVARRGKTMQFWGDIIDIHPNLVPLLPTDAVALAWGYEADHPFNIVSERFAAAGLPFYVCPGTSSWTSLGGRTNNALANLLNAAENGHANGASGYLITDWGDFGHWQTLPISYIGFAAGAALSWCLEENRDLSVPDVVSHFAFHDASGVTGKAFYNLGRIYQAPGINIPNASVLFWVLQWPKDQVAQYSEKLSQVAEIQSRGETAFNITLDTGDPFGSDLSPNGLAKRFEKTLDMLDLLEQSFTNDRMLHRDRELIRREFSNTVRLMRFAAKRAIDAVLPGELEFDLKAEIDQFLAEYQDIWLQRNRPGGLKDSIQRFVEIKKEYSE